MQHLDDHMELFVAPRDHAARKPDHHLPGDSWGLCAIGAFVDF